MATTIEQLSDDDLDALFDFFRTNSSNGDLFQIYWQWRNENKNRWKGEAAVVAKSEDRITGCLGMVPALITYGGNLVDGRWQQDSLVRTSMRGQGIGSKLIDIGGAGCEIVLAKGTNGMYRLRKNKGFKDVPNSNFLLRVLHPRSGGVSIRQLILEWTLAAWSRLIPPVRSQTEIVVDEIKQFDEAFDYLSQQVSKETVLRLEKKKEYLNWRYTACPGRRYIIYRASGKLSAGGIVLNLAGKHKQEGWIVDLICKSSDQPIAYELLATALRFFKNYPVMRVWCFSTAPWARRWLYRFGFVPTNRTPRFTFKRKLQFIEPKNLSQRTWDIWHGDGDVELYS